MKTMDSSHLLGETSAIGLGENGKKQVLISAERGEVVGKGTHLNCHRNQVGPKNVERIGDGSHNDFSETKFFLGK